MLLRKSLHHFKMWRMVYIYPEKDLRAYPGTIRGTEEWDNTYKIRTAVERDINHSSLFWFKITDELREFRNYLSFERNMKILWNNERAFLERKSA